MKWFHFAHGGLTLLLCIVFIGFVVMLLAGVIEVRRRTVGTGPEPSQSAQVGDIKAHLLVMRGLRSNWEYRIYAGRNVIGRADQQPVDIDLQPQEPEDRIWSSRQHASITLEGGSIVIEDLNSANGTYINAQRVPPGEKRPLWVGDIIQIGEVQLKVLP
jgi:hypothetical protein